MLQTQIKQASESDLIALMKAAVAELDRRHSAAYSHACSDASSNVEAAIDDLDCEIGLHLEFLRNNPKSRFAEVEPWKEWAA